MYILEDEQRQCQRVQSAHIELFRLYMLDQFRDVTSAHKHLLESFRVCDQLVHEPIVAESPDLESMTKGAACDWRGHRDDEYKSSKYKYGAIKEDIETNCNKKQKAKVKSSASRAGVARSTGLSKADAEESLLPVRILGDGWQVRNNSLRYAHNILKTYVVRVFEAI